MVHLHVPGRARRCVYGWVWVWASWAINHLTFSPTTVHKRQITCWIKYASVLTPSKQGSSTKKVRAPPKNRWILKQNKTCSPCGWCKRTRSSYWRTVKVLKATGDLSQYCNTCSSHHRTNDEFSDKQRQKYVALWDQFHLKEDDREKSPPAPATLEEYIPAFHARAAEVIGSNGKFSLPPLMTPFGNDTLEMPPVDTTDPQYTMQESTRGDDVPLPEPNVLDLFCGDDLFNQYMVQQAEAERVLMDSTSLVIAPDRDVNCVLPSDAPDIVTPTSTTQAPVMDDWLMEQASQFNQILDAMTRSGAPAIVTPTSATQAPATDDWLEDFNQILDAMHCKAK